MGAAGGRRQGGAWLAAGWLLIAELSPVIAGAAVPAAAAPRTAPHGAAAAVRALSIEHDPEPPSVLFGDLFAAVQSLQVLPDGKDFVDAVPRFAPAQIMARYRSANPRTVEALKAFVSANFALPAAATAEAAASAAVPIDEHIDRLWSELTRTTAEVPPFSSALPLPHPYVVPGGRFREIYYWDSYFTMLGLAESGREDLIDDMVSDFAHLIDRYGHIPNGARTYYLSRSQPPFFFEMVELLAPGDPASAYARYLPQLRREYAFWMDGERGLAPGTAHRRLVAMPLGGLLNRYWDDRDEPRDESYREDVALAKQAHRPPRQVFRDIRAAAESGWDFGSRWFQKPQDRSSIDTTAIVPVDLNALLFGLERAIGAGCGQDGDRACAREFSSRAAARRAAIDRYLWDGEFGAYLDYRWPTRERIARISAATLYPLFLSVATPAQAAAVAATTQTQLLKAGGLVATPLDTGEQWDSPNGWAPLQWIAVAGLRAYGEPRLAAAIACRWIVTVDQVYRDQGRLVEKYDVARTGREGGGGEYPTQDGFGWTNGVMRRLETIYPAARAMANIGECPEP